MTRIDTDCYFDNYNPQIIAIMPKIICNTAIAR